jgi:DNA-binding MarR family transcriptional regulator
MQAKRSEFRYEYEMLPFIINSLPTVQERHARIALATEYNKGYRQIDLMAAFTFEQSDNWRQWASIAALVHKLTYAKIEVLAVLAHSKTISSQELAKKTWLTIREADKYIAEFIDLGLAKRVRGRNYGPTTWAKQIPMCLVAIEAKLTDWPSALKQAIYNKPSVDYSCVAIPLIDFRDRISVLNEFRSRGIGVMGISNDGHSKVLIRPKRKPINPIDYLISTLRVVSELSSSGKWTYVQP